MPCNKCKHWHRMKLNEGMCRRHPPIPISIPMGNKIVSNSFFPSTMGHIHCGDFEEGEPTNADTVATQ